MLKEKYKIEFEKLENEGNNKYFIVGSPTNLNTTKIISADTLKKIWESLLEMNEIDITKYETDHEIFDEEKEIYYIAEPTNYKDAIGNYLKDSNNFYYRKMNF